MSRVKVEAVMVDRVSLDYWRPGHWRFILKARGQVLYRSGGDYPTKEEALEMGKGMVKTVRSQVGDAYLITYFEDRIANGEIVI